MKQIQPNERSEPIQPLCKNCGGLMRLIGSEADPVKAEMDILTYTCTSCDEYLLVSVKTSQSALDLFRSASGHPDEGLENKIAIFPAEPGRFDNSHATLIVCDKCGGRAHLVDCAPPAIALGLRETWSFECEACGVSLKRSVER